MLYLVLPLVMVLGIFICYHDIRHGIIRNRFILIMFLLGLFYQISFGILLTSAIPVISTVIYGFLISLLLWWLGIWPGGDAKLFAVLLLLFPPGLYLTSPVIPYLVNVFVPFFAFMTGYVLLKSRAGMIGDALRYSLKPYRISFIFLMLVGFMWFFMGLLKLAGIQGDYFITILILFVVYELFSIAMSAKTETLFIGLAAVRAVLDFWNLFSLASLQYFLLIVGSFVFFRFFLLHIAYYAFTNEIKIDKLRPGMILAEGISSEGRGYARVSFLYSSLLEFLRQKRRRFIHSHDELTKSDVRRIKRLRRQGRIKFGDVRICQTQPFAAFILAGYLLTLFFHGGLLGLF
jgi:Flp pilus assembly protein protease CpaA